MLNLTNVTKQFGNVLAIEAIDLPIPKGTFVSLLGPSGCGKSTLLSIMAGLERQSGGSVKVDGHELSGPNSRAGMVFQRDLLLPWKTALQNVLLQFTMRGHPTKPHEERARALLDRVGLTEFVDAYPDQLSGGMRQRVALCRALIHDPDLLLMDEPFGALDAITREKVAIDLADLTSSGNKTVIFVTHSLEEAVFLGDIVYVLSARPGRLVNQINVDLPRPRREWPRGISPFTAYIDHAFTALKKAGAYDAVAI